MSARLLPVGSYIQLHKPLNLPGPGTSSKWTVNGKAQATSACVQFMVRDDVGYWLFVPAGHHKGWAHVPFDGVQYCRCEPPQDVTDAIDRERMRLEAEEAKATKAASKAGAKTGADTQHQTSSKPAAA